MSSQESRELTRLIRKPAVVKATGLPQSTLYRLISEGRFPAPIKVGERASAWLESEVAAWIASRVADRDAKAVA